MTPGLIYDPYFLSHVTGHHPENPGRLIAVTALLGERGYMDGLPRLGLKPATRSELLAVHGEAYVRRLEAMALRGGGHLTPDTPVGEESFAVARLAAGAAISAAIAAYRGEPRRVMALVRPPGHHACAEQGMGFCLLSNVAIAARAARAAGASRVLIVDFDVHHGNGTQEAFYTDPTVMFFSTHQYPAYPGTGAAEEIGSGLGRGTTVNVPLPAGVGDAGYLKVYSEILPGVARRFRPDLILVSAGYDAHWTNSAYLSSIRMNVTATGFAAIVRQIAGLSDELCDGKMALVLEGGYDPESLAWSVVATLDALLGRGIEDPVGPPQVEGREPDLGALLAHVRSLHGLDLPPS